MNAAELIIAIFGLIAAVVGVFYTRKSYLWAKRKARIQIKIYGENSSANLIYVLPFKDEHTIVFPLSIKIENIGQLSAQGVEVHLELPDYLFRRDMSERLLSAIAAAKGLTFAAEPGDSKGLTRFYISIGDISPGSRYHLDLDLVVRSPSSLTFDVPAQLKDGISRVFRVNLGVTWPAQLAVTAKDILAQNVNFSMMFIRDSITNKSELVKIAKSIIQGKRDDFRDAPESFSLIGFTEYSTSTIKYSSNSQHEICSAISSTVIGLNASTRANEKSLRHFLSSFFR